MPLDPSIILGVQAPKFTPPQDLYAMKAKIDQNELATRLGALKVDDAERGIKETNAIADAYKYATGADGKVDRPSLVSRLAQSGFGSKIPTIQKGFADSDKVDTETQAAKFKLEKDKADAVLNALSGATDQPSYDLALKTIKAQGGDLSNAPPAFDPKFVQYAGNQVLTHKQRLETAEKAAQQAETVRHNQSTESLTARGQNMVDNRKSQELNGADNAFSPDAIKNAAARYNIDGTLPPMGMGKSGSAGRAAILNEAAVQANTSGVSPDDQRIAQIGNKANSASLTKLQTQQSMVGAFEKNFNKNADIALDYSARVDRTGTPILNKWINAGKRSVAGDPDLAAFDQAIKSASNEYAKIISGSMGNTATAIGEIKSMEDKLNSAQTPQQVSAVLGLMKRETANRMSSFDEEKKSLRDSMVLKNPAAPVATTPTSTVTASPFDPAAIAAELKKRGH